MKPNEWRFDFGRDIAKPESPEAKLICAILNTYFSDIDLMSFRRKYSAEELKNAELSLYMSSGIPPVNLERLKRNVYSISTRELCSWIDIKHSYFLYLIDKYLHHRVNFGLNDF